jgi:hypothetical protein
VQLPADTISAPRIGNPLNDHDLITTAHDGPNALCAIEPIITTTINGSIAHNLSA